MSGQERPRQGTGRPTAQRARQGCCHYWVIGFPDGPTSGAKCRFCGEERQFSNYLRLSDDATKEKAKTRYVATYATDTKQQQRPYAMQLDRYDRSLALALLGEVEVGSHR